MAKPYQPYSGPIVTRAEGEAAGLKKFFTGEPCANGHLSQRRLPKGKCIRCVGDAFRRWKALHPGAAESAHEAWKVANPGAAQAATVRWQKANPDKLALYETRRDPIKRRANQKAAAVRKPVETAARQLRCAKKRRLNGKARAWENSHYAAHPEKRKAKTQTRRAREANADGTHTAAEIKALYKAQRGCCAYFGICGNKLGKDYHEDHIVPLADEGTNWISNIQLTCGPCNLQKGAKDPLVFARKIGLLL